MSAILNFIGLRMGSLKAYVGLFIGSVSIEIIALNCLVFEKIAFCVVYSFFAADKHRQTDK